MKSLKTFDIRDKNITPELYTLLFGVIKLTANDTWYQIYPLDFELDNEYKERKYKQRIERGSGNCYFDNELMKKFIDKPYSYQEAVKLFHKWLKEQNVDVDNNEMILFKIWW